MTWIKRYKQKTPFPKFHSVTSYPWFGVFHWCIDYHACVEFIVVNNNVHENYSFFILKCTIHNEQRIPYPNFQNSKKGLFCTFMIFRFRIYFGSLFPFENWFITWKERDIYIIDICIFILMSRGYNLCSADFDLKKQQQQHQQQWICSPIPTPVKLGKSANQKKFSLYC